jgi:hypothetical protein
MSGVPIHRTHFPTSHFGKLYFWTVNPDTGRARMIPMQDPHGLPGGVGPMPPSLREAEIDWSNPEADPAADLAAFHKDISP